MTVKIRISDVYIVKTMIRKRSTKNDRKKEEIRDRKSDVQRVPEEQRDSTFDPHNRIVRWHPKI